MIDKILESDNSQKLEILREVTEKNPQILDILIRNKSFQKLDDIEKIDIIVNKGSIDKLFKENNFEELSCFVNFKPSCVEDIKKHPQFDSSPLEFRSQIFTADKDKTMDLDIIKNNITNLDTFKDKDKTMDLDVI